MHLVSNRFDKTVVKVKGGVMLFILNIYTYINYTPQTPKQYKNVVQFYERLNYSNTILTISFKFC